MASVESPEGVIHRIVALLEAAGIPYMLTGSFASGYHGAPRATQDIDLVISPNLGSLNKLLGLLPEDEYYVSRDAADAMGIVHIQGEALDVSYITQWAERLGLTEHWNVVVARCGLTQQ